MKKKVSIFLIISIFLALSILITYLIYIFTDKFSIALHYAFHPEDFVGVHFGFEGLAKSIMQSIVIFLCLAIILALNILSLIYLIKADSQSFKHGLKLLFTNSREKRHQKKIEKAKALLESEDKRDE